MKQKKLVPKKGAAVLAVSMDQLFKDAIESVAADAGMTASRLMRKAAYQLIVDQYDCGHADPFVKAQECAVCKIKLAERLEELGQNTVSEG